VCGPAAYSADRTDDYGGHGRHIHSKDRSRYRHIEMSTPHAAAGTGYARRPCRLDYAQPCAHCASGRVFTARPGWHRRSTAAALCKRAGPRRPSPSGRSIDTRPAHGSTGRAAVAVAPESARCWTPIAPVERARRGDSGAVFTRRQTGTH
jgi:hypothetical protein